MALKTIRQIIAPARDDSERIIELLEQAADRGNDEAEEILHTYKTSDSKDDIQEVISAYLDDYCPECGQFGSSCLC